MVHLSGILSNQDNYSLTILNEMTFPLSNITNATAEWRRLIKNRFMMLFTLIQGHPTRVGIARLSSAFVKVVCRIHGTALPRKES